MDFPRKIINLNIFNKNLITPLKSPLKVFLEFLETTKSEKCTYKVSVN